MRSGAEVIRSAANPRVKRLRSLAGARGVRRHAATLVCGRRLVAETLRDQSQRVECVVCDESHEGDDGAPAAVPRLVLAGDIFREIDVLGTGSPVLVVSVEEPPSWRPDTECDGRTLFLPLGDPENLGAALRSAAAFAVDRVVLTREAAHPFHLRAVRASAGACFSLQLRRGPDLASLLARPPVDLELLALDRPGEALDRVAVDVGDRDFGLVVGEEGSGLPAGGPARRVEIPIEDRIESLNAGVAVGIALWALTGRFIGRLRRHGSDRPLRGGL